MARVAKWSVLIIAIVITTALVVAGVALLALHEGYPAVSGALADLVSRSIPGRITFGTLRWRGLDTLEVEDVVVYDPSGTRVASLGRARIPLGLDSLAGGVHTGPLDADALWLDLRPGSDGRQPLARAFTTGRPGSGDPLAWSVTIRSLRELRILLPGAGVEAARVEGTAAGTGGDLTAQVLARGVSATMDGEAPIEVETLEGRVKLERGVPGRLTVEALRLTSPHGTVEVRGSLRGGAFDAELTLTRVDARALLAPFLDAELVPGRVDGTIDVARDGRQRPLRIDAELDLRDVRQLGRVSAKVVGARIESERATVGRLAIRHAGGGAEVAGALPLRAGGELELEVQVVADQPTALALPEAIERATFRGQVRGTYAAPRAEGSLEVHARLPGRSGALEVAAIDADLYAHTAFDRAALTFSDVELRGPGVVTGWLQISSPLSSSPGLAGHLASDTIPAGALIAGASGTLAVEVELAGKLRRPQITASAIWSEGTLGHAITHEGVRVSASIEAPGLGATGRATLHADALALAGRPLGDLEVDASLDRGVLRLTGSTGDDELGHLRADVEGEIRPGSAWRGTLEVDSVRPNVWLPAKVGLLGVLDGELDLEGRLGGEGSPWPRVSGTVTLSEPGLFGRPIGEAFTVAVESSADAALPYRLGAALPPILELTGELDPKSGVLRLRGDLDDAPVPLPVDVETPEELHAQVSGQVELEVGLGGKAPPLAVRAVIAPLYVSTPTGMVVSHTRATVRFENGALTIHDLHLHSGESRLVVDWSGDAGRARGEIDAALIGPFVPALAGISGRVGVDAELRPGETFPRGRLWVATKLGFTVRELGRRFEVVAGNLRFDARRLVLDGVRGRSRGGTFEARGEVHLDEGLQPKEVDVGLRATGLRVVRDQASLELDADIRVMGTYPELVAKGRIDLVAGRYLREVELRALALVFVHRTPVEPREPLGPPWRDIRLELHTVSREPFRLEVQAGVLELRSELEADLHIEGTLGEPLLSGVVRTVEGTLRLPHAELQVVQGRIDFDHGDEQILIVAEGEADTIAGGMPSAGDSLVSLTLEGDLDELRLDLTSADVGLAPTEVLLLATTGSADLGDGRDATLDTALAFAGDQLAAPVTNYLERQLNDLFESEVELTTAVVPGGVRVGAATELTPRLVLRGWYQQAVGDAPSYSSGSLQFLITDRLFLEAIAARLVGEATSTDPLAPSTGTRLGVRYRLWGP